MKNFYWTSDSRYWTKNLYRFARLKGRQNILGPLVFLCEVCYFAYRSHIYFVFIYNVLERHFVLNIKHTRNIVLVMPNTSTITGTPPPYPETALMTKILGLHGFLKMPVT